MKKTIKICCIFLALAVLLCSIKCLAAVPKELGETEFEFIDAAMSVCSAPIEDFSVLDLPVTSMGMGGDRGYRYLIAFVTYGLANAYTITPAYPGPYQWCIGRLIQKMEDPKTTAYWKEAGYGDDPLKENNIMYRGHLSLMYGLYQYLFGDKKYEEKYKKVTGDIYEEMMRTPYRGVLCEPNHLFVQCNSVAILSFYLHDQMFGTNYSEAGTRFLRWAEENMTYPQSNLFLGVKHPDEHLKCNMGADETLSGYANAWTLTFLNGVPSLRQYARRMYDSFKKDFIVDAGTIVYFRGRPDEGMEPLATLFGIMAVREMEDDAVFKKILRTQNNLMSVMMESARTAGLEPQHPAATKLIKGVMSFLKSFNGWHNIIQPYNEIVFTYPRLEQLSNKKNRVIAARFYPDENLLSLKLNMAAAGDVTVRNVSSSKIYRVTLDEVPANIVVKENSMDIKVPAGAHSVTVMFSK